MINKQYSGETDEQYRAREWKDMGATYVIIGITGLLIGAYIFKNPQGAMWTSEAFLKGFSTFVKISGGFILLTHKVYSAEVNQAITTSQKKKDPLIFDLNNDSILETTDIYHGVYFDHENDGFAVDFSRRVDFSLPKINGGLKCSFNAFAPNNIIKDILH